MNGEQGRSTSAILALTQAIETARRQVEADDTPSARAKFKDAQIAYRSYLLGLNGLAQA